MPISLRGALAALAALPIMAAAQSAYPFLSLIHI